MTTDEAKDIVIFALSLGFIVVSLILGGMIDNQPIEVDNHTIEWNGEVWHTGGEK